MDNRQRRHKRHFRVRIKVKGTQVAPRLTVFRSNKNIYAQIVDDNSARTLASASSLKLKEAKSETGSKESKKISQAQAVGESLATIAQKNKIKKVVFDRGGYKYHGRVKSLAEGARKGGLIF